MRAPTSVAGRARRTALRLSAMSAQLEHPRLLPGVLVPDPDRNPRKRTTRDWIVDFACFAIAVVFGFLVFAEAMDHMSDDQQFFDLVGGLIASLALWWRRRWPVGVALFVAALNTYSASSAVAGAIALFTVAVHRRAAIAFALAALTLAITPIFLAINPDDEVPYWFNLVIAVLASGAVVAWGMFVRSRRQLVLSLRDRAERAEAEQQLRVAQARQHERARIAREMHDVLAHRISLLSLHAGALEFRPDAPPAEVARAAGVIRASAHEALEDLRTVIGVLREGADGGDAPERPQPTLADLPALIDESRQAGMHVSYDWRLPDSSAVPAGAGRNAYRIVQEGLTNARKHAHGAAVEVSVDGAEGKGLTIEVRNRLPVGVAATAIPGTGTGIVGLAERASLAGGRLEHGRTSSGDWRLWAWLPWPA